MSDNENENTEKKRIEDLVYHTGSVYLASECEKVNRGESDKSVAERAVEVKALDKLVDFPEFFSNLVINEVKAETESGEKLKYLVNGAVNYMNEVPDAVKLANFCKENNVSMDGLDSQKLQELGFERNDETVATNYQFIDIAKDYINSKTTENNI